MENIDPIYKQVPEKYVKELLDFRKTHPFESRKINEVEWKYIFCGRGESVILLLGGAMSTAETSRSLIDLWESNYRVLSPSYPVYQTMRSYLDGLAELLDLLDIRRVHVFGQSLGAGIGHALIRRYPDRIEKLVLSSFGLYENENSRKMKYALRLFRFLPYWFVREYYQRRLPNLLQGVDEDEKQFFEAFMKDVFDLQLNKKLIMSQFNVLEDMFTNPVYYRIFEPIPSKDIMILQARDDTGFEESEQEALRKTYPNAAIHIFEEGGHLTRSAIQAEYDDVLNNFLGKKMKS